MSRDEPEVTAQQAKEIAHQILGKEYSVDTILRWHREGKYEGRQIPGGIRSPFVYNRVSLLAYLHKKSAIKSPNT